ncbi:transporter [Ganoderma sinense ZZ0214-1]|uniref:Transporter n=1 Tax=Ganoderma sinense ZZ0214-1 TaxID=1077348 RepID=A0A2G8RT95_9APHY|nr:transporter [Ganoderma sinense ZZ0214-1]
MDAAQFLQTVLSVIPNPQYETPLAIPPGVSAGPSTSQSPVLEGPTAALMNLPQLIVSIFSMAAFWDWMKLLLLGAFLESCRRRSAEVWAKLVDCMWVTGEFQSNGEAADWLMHWLSQKKVFRMARNVEVCTLCADLDGVRMDDLDDDEEASSTEQVVFLPSLYRTYSLWYRGRYMTITRTRISEANMWKGPLDMIEISMLTRNPGLLRELLKEARKAFKAANGHLINVFVAQGAEGWTRVAAQQKRPMSSVILDPGVIELVLEDARDFLNSRKWYADRGIPFRRGYLLHGAPGAGKTSMIHSIAGELGLDIYILSLTVVSLNDNSLKALISRLPKSCILLMEDVDAAFARGLPRRDLAGPDMPIPTMAPGGEKGGPQLDGADGVKGPRGTEGGFNGVTLSGLLNALDGIAAQEGRILFATTNDYAALDPALLRPGRLDLHIKFGLASEHQARELFKRFYTSSSDVPAEDSGDENGDTLREKVEDLGYTSRTGPPVRESQEASEPAADQSMALAMPEGVKSVYVGMTPTGHGFQLSQKKAAALAERFAAAIPPHTFSMATLQGYLMAYKVRPYVAVEEAPEWVEKNIRENAAQTAAAAAKGTGNSSTSIIGKNEGSSGP